MMKQRLADITFSGLRVPIGLLGMLQMLGRRVGNSTYRHHLQK